MAWRLLFISAMIGKIDPQNFLGRNPFSTSANQKRDRAEFLSYLEEKMGEPIAMERIALQILKKTVDLALSETETEESGLFLSSPLVLSRLPGSRNPQPTPEALELEVDSTASNYLPIDQDFESIIQEAGQRYRVDPGLIRAVMQAESGGNPLAVSRTGARGLMQLMPETASELGVTNPFDPTQNIMGGTSYLRRLLDRYRGDVKLALAAYNWGMGNLERHPEAMPRETKNFVAAVEKNQRTPIKA
jgi:soluble lytic murein transglycosylase-like protein